MKASDHSEPRWGIIRALGRSVGIGLLGMTLPAAVFGASSIFDDDWKPAPESSKPVPAAPAKPPPDEPVQAAPRLPPRVRPKREPVKPAPVTPAPGPANPITPAAARAPVPGPAVITAAEKVLKDIFKTEYASKTAAEQIAFSRTLLSEAEQIQNDPPTLYVLLRDSRDMASAGGEPEVALEAARGMRDNFLMDPHSSREMEESTLAGAVRVLCGSTPAIASYDVCHRASDLAMEMAELDFAEGDYSGAAQVGATAEMAARKTRDWEYPTRVQTRVAWLQAVNAAFEADRASIALLKANSADPAANLAAGRFDFVYLDRPDLGLPLLAKGSDAPLMALAQKDLAASAGAASTPALLTAAADGWVEAAKTEPPPIKDAMQRRALFLYDQAVPAVQGLEQAAVEKKVEDLQMSRVLRGLTVEFFRGEDLKCRVFTRNDRSILYHWAGTLTPEVSIPRERFSARWTGFIKAVPGTYRLVAVHDDGARIWLDGELIVDHWKRSGKSTVPVRFTGQMKSLKVEFRQHEGPATMGLGWTVPGSTKTVGIPESAYFHEPIPPGPAIEPCTSAGTDGRIRLTGGAATVHGRLIGYYDEGEGQCVGFWKDMTDWVNWDLAAAEGDYAVDVDYACTGPSSGSTYVLSIGTNRLTGRVTSTGNWHTYQTIRLGRVHLGAGLSSLRVKPLAKPGEAVMNLQAVVLTPARAGD